MNAKQAICLWKIPKNKTTAKQNFPFSDHMEEAEKRWMGVFVYEDV